MTKRDPVKKSVLAILLAESSKQAGNPFLKYSKYNGEVSVCVRNGEVSVCVRTCVQVYVCTAVYKNSDWTSVNFQPIRLFDSAFYATIVLLGHLITKVCALTCLMRIFAETPLYKCSCVNP